MAAPIAAIELGVKGRSGVLNDLLKVFLGPAQPGGAGAAPAAAAPAQPLVPDRKGAMLELMALVKRHQAKAPRR